MSIDLDKLRVFYAASEAGSFTHAGERLSLSQSAVSRQIAALEEEIGVSLFQRHARGLVLTEQGELLHRTARDIFASLEHAEAMLQDSRDKPKGDLRVTATHGLATYWLVPRLADFRAQFPDITLHLILEDRELDLASREADVAIRMRAPVQADLVQRRLFTLRYHLYASEAYLARRGVPQRLEDLDDHDLIVYSEAPPQELRSINWLLEAGRKGLEARRPVLRANAITALLTAVEAGIGIAALPDYLGRDRPGLVCLMPDEQGPQFDVHFVYAEAQRHSKRVGVFRDFLVKHAKDWTF